MTGGGHMAKFWDARAREDAWYFVDDRLAYRDPDHDRFWAGGERDLATIFERLGVEPRPTDRVVEIGCGVGRLTRPLAGRAAEVRALDVSGEMIELARRHNPALSNVAWLRGDGTSLEPIPDGWADACLSHVVFQHIPDPGVTLGYVAEMGRVLRVGGWAAFQVSTDPAIHRGARGLRAAAQRLRALAGRGPRGRHDPAWLGCAVRLEDLRAAAAGAGLRLERVEEPGTQFTLVLARRTGT